MGTRIPNLIATIFGACLLGGCLTLRPVPPDPSIDSLLSLADGAEALRSKIMKDDSMNCPAMSELVSEVRNNRHYFLSELLGPDNECRQVLPCFLSRVPNTRFSNATLVIDQVCTVDRPLILPKRFTLAGVGRQGEGILDYQGPVHGAAIYIQPGAASHVSIRDLAISGGSYGRRGLGLLLSNNHLVTLENVSITGFELGVFGRVAFSVLASGNTVFDNGHNFVLGREANHWVIRDNVISGASHWGVRLLGIDDIGFESNNHLITGGRFESNGQGAIYAGARGTVIMGNRFEGNGDNGSDPRFPKNAGIVVRPGAAHTRILANHSGRDLLVNYAGRGTECAHNMGRQCSNRFANRFRAVFSAGDMQ